VKHRTKIIEEPQMVVNNAMGEEEGFYVYKTDNPPGLRSTMIKSPIQPFVPGQNTKYSIG
jgi:hypothetical protein